MTTTYGENHQDRVELFMERLADGVPHDRARLPSAHFLWVRARWVREEERRARAERVRWTIESILVLAALAAAIYWGIPRIGSLVGQLGPLSGQPLLPSVDPVMVVLVSCSLFLLLTVGASRALWAIAR